MSPISAQLCNSLTVSARHSQFVTQVRVIDPESRLPVEISVFKADTGGMFAIDSSFLEQVFDENAPNIAIPCPFNPGEYRLVND